MLSSLVALLQKTEVCNCSVTCPRPGKLVEQDVGLGGLAPEGSLIAALHHHVAAAASASGLQRGPGGDLITNGSVEAELGRILKLERRLLVYEI